MLTVPTIHMNGSDPEVLLENYQAAIAACQEALDLLEACAPNARDHYVQSAGAMAQASKEHAERVQKLISVKVDLGFLAESVQQQIDIRKAGRLR